MNTLHIQNSFILFRVICFFLSASVSGQISQREENSVYIENENLVSQPLTTINNINPVQKKDKIYIIEGAITKNLKESTSAEIVYLSNKKNNKKQYTTKKQYTAKKTNPKRKSQPIASQKESHKTNILETAHPESFITSLKISSGISTIPSYRNEYSGCIWRFKITDFLFCYLRPSSHFLDSRSVFSFAAHNIIRPPPFYVKLHTNNLIY